MSSVTMSLEQAALDAVANHTDSHVEMAMAFVKKACLDFLREDNDRLLKVGRSLESLVALKEKEMVSLEPSLETLVEECKLLASGNVKVQSECHWALLCVFCVCMFACFWFANLKSCLFWAGPETPFRKDRVANAGRDVGLHEVSAQVG